MQKYGDYNKRLAAPSQGAASIKFPACHRTCIVLYRDVASTPM